MIKVSTVFICDHCGIAAEDNLIQTKGPQLSSYFSIYIYESEIPKTWERKKIHLDKLPTRSYIFCSNNCKEAHPKALKLKNLLT